VNVIRLSNGQETLIDERLFDALNVVKWYVSTSGYVTNRNKSRTLRIHRMILQLNGIEIPDGKEVDHINHDRLDNRFENLRLTDRSHNLANRSGYPNKTGFRGVVKRESGRFRGSIERCGKKYLTPTFDTPEEAARARDEIVKSFYGEFATLNFPVIV
jgi:hypothetical protein